MASSSKGGSSRPTSTFSFDVTKPVKKGFLNKQGKTIQRFKNRFFVLYPGFLVYYDEETKWRRDYTRGDTLEVFFESRARVYIYYSISKTILSPNIKIMVACREKIKVVLFFKHLIFRRTRPKIEVVLNL